MVITHLRWDSQLLREEVESYPCMPVNTSFARITRTWAIARILYSKHVYVQKVAESLD